MARRENGTGTIYQRSNGSWVGRIYIGVDMNGKEKFKYLSGKTEREVKKKIRDYNQTGVKIDTNKISLRDYLYNWLKTFKRGTIKESSYDALEKTIRNQIVPYIGMVQLQQITSADIQKLLNDLKEKGYSYSTIKKAHDCLNDMFEHATITDAVVKNPMAAVKMLASSEFEKKEIRYFNEEECSLIIEESSREYSTGKPVYQYADAYILMLNTGIRLGEAIGLRGILFHTDCVQAVGCRSIDVKKIGCDFATISSHKIHGPKGVGALFVKDPSMWSPMIRGGDSQEFGLRGGTENVAGIVGFGTACEILSKTSMELAAERMEALKHAFLTSLNETVFLK